MRRPTALRTKYDLAAIMTYFDSVVIAFGRVAVGQCISSDPLFGTLRTRHTAELELCCRPAALGTTCDCEKKWMSRR